MTVILLRSEQARMMLAQWNASAKPVKNDGFRLGHNSTGLWRRAKTTDLGFSYALNALNIIKARQALYDVVCYRLFSFDAVSADGRYYQIKRWR